MTEYDAIVIGGGVIGSSLTYYLSKLRKKVLLVEKTDLCSGSAGATDGYITPHTKKPGYHLEMALKSCELYETLAEDLESDINLELGLHCGGIQACEDEMQWELISRNAAELSKSGLELYMLDIEDARKIEPELSPRLRGALFSPIASSVNPMRLTQAYVDAAKKFGAKVLLHTEVQGLLFEGERVSGVSTPNGSFSSEYTVNCGGSWGGVIAKMAGLDLPIIPKRGQIIVSEPVAPMLNTVMQSGIYPIIKYKPELIQDERIFRLGLAFGIEQTKDGTLLIGGTRELAGFDRGNTFEAIEAVLKTVSRYIPAILHLNFIRCFSGLRPHTPDGLPILGKVKSVPGFVMCCGHEGDGIALAPITGKLVAEDLVYGEPSFPISPCATERFLTNREMGGG
ncbi:MAG TPA: FAD-dependent oxidoreductase [Ruminococcaceae bacterium]|jgi:sarcosine oxidase subunit beta|nr:FAD-dependent oxidoreductase [Oscillospiraceae bacterium]